jgi:hypothetical protein
VKKVVCWDEYIISIYVYIYIFVIKYFDKQRKRYIASYNQGFQKL